MKRILLTQGKYTIVDDENYGWLMQWKWCVSKKHRSWYAVRGTERGGIQKTYQMHNFIMPPPKNKEIDHKNGDGLDNRKCNLRICTHAENIRNQRTRITKGTSIFKGVCFEKQTGSWKAQIGFNKKSINLGRYKSEIEAARVYDSAAKNLYKQYAQTNF